MERMRWQALWAGPCAEQHGGMTDREHQSLELWPQLLGGWCTTESWAKMESKSTAPLSHVKFEVSVKHPSENVKSAGVRVGLERGWDVPAASFAAGRRAGLGRGGGPREGAGGAARRGSSATCVALGLAPTAGSSARGARSSPYPRPQD